ncbi:site-specific integrase [Microbacterium sp. 13-71-7]|jgi:integrase|uniref:tyrosine-type recombinase/integrase n=1 Tax=Microbacterium sp. 13-71-7 TaxID=1970399 RepID=UPI000BC3BC40|nr:site-specific integrase [Microbacterium sp. 13-71-7]OZB80463.1 MAG: hypothetical protein B7X32_19340 [Microbacterium sp. 13-71-7]
MGRPRLEPGELGSVSYTILESGRIRARCLIRNGAGDPLHISAVGRTAAEADTALHRKASVAWGSLILAFEPTITLRELAGYWLTEELEPSDRKQSTKEGYESILRLAILPHLGAFPMIKITAGVCDRFLKMLRRDHANGYALNARAVLGLLLRFARRHEAMSTNPLADADRIPTPATTFVDLEFEQLVGVFELMRAWRGANPGRQGGGRPNVELLIDVCLVMLGTSMRIGEVLALRKQDVVVDGDLTRVKVQGTISETKKYGIIRQSVPKRERQIRSIVAPRFAARVLRRRVVEYQENTEDLLFPTRRGTPRSTHNIGRLMRGFREQNAEQLEALGIDLATFSTRAFRKTAATTVFASTEIELARLLLGHARAETTFAHYIKPNLDVPGITADVLDARYPFADLEGADGGSPTLADRYQ